MKRRLVSLVLTVCLVLSLAPAALAADHPFRDVKSNDWFGEYVAYVYGEGLMRGTSDAMFEPQTTMSRAMLVTVLWRMAGEPYSSGYCPFYDVPDWEWYAEPVAWAWENGVVMGTSDTMFSPNNDITREQMVTIFHRFAQAMSLDTAAWVELSGYSDLRRIDSWASEAFGWAVAQGMIAGNTDGTLNPDGNATRAECATIIWRFDRWMDGIQPGHTPAFHDAKRQSYNKGTNKQLTGKPYVVVLFLDDNESHWTQPEIEAFWDEDMYPALDYLSEKAWQWGVDLEFQTGYYCTGGDIRVHYDGILGSDGATGDYSPDALDKAAKSLGFASDKAMRDYLKSISGSSEVVFVVAANKDGRSYSLCDSVNDGYEYEEYCMVYPDFPNYAYDTPASTVAHEILHLFGAEDYYDPYGDRPQRKAYAEEICPYDIMLTVYVDITYNEVGDFTAYTVGWMNYLTDEYKDSRWWN